ncbi:MULTISPECIES: PspC domain-containing protein [unclassified Luteococcus]|uniref:PspC domain-containing protein n=1 Tax=unclassified Luteococcus TaxID=2639923 RepID=UPI00313BA307
METHAPALYRSRDDALLAGVCFALAQRLRVDPLLVRVAAVVLALSSGFGIALYAWAWLVLPQKGRSQSFAQQWFPPLDGLSRQQQLTLGLAVSLACTLLFGSVAAWSVAPGIVLLIMVALARRQRSDAEPTAQTAPSPAFPSVAPGSQFALATQAWADRLDSLGHHAEEPNQVVEQNPDLVHTRTIQQNPDLTHTQVIEPDPDLEYTQVIEPAAADNETTRALEIEHTERIEHTQVLNLEHTVPLPPEPGQHEPTRQLPPPNYPPPTFPPPPPAAPVPAPAPVLAATAGGPPFVPTGFQPMGPPAHTQASPYQQWAPPTPTRRRPRKSLLLGLLVLALAAGAARLAALSGVMQRLPGADPRLLQHGAALAVLSLALLSCALLRLPRPRLAVLAGLLVFASAVAPPLDRSMVEPRDVTWTSVSQLPTNRIELAATEASYDLSGLDLSGASPHTVSIRATAADVKLVLPHDADVRIDYRLTGADLEVTRGRETFTADGQRTGSWPESRPDNPRLVIELDLRAAAAQVRHA